MLRGALILAPALLVCPVTGTPAVASPCSDGIVSLSGRVRTEARESIAASTGSKPIAARRESEGETGAAPAPDRREAGTAGAGGARRGPDG
jgi:hypothetical protein